MKSKEIISFDIGDTNLKYAVFKNYKIIERNVESTKTFLGDSEKLIKKIIEIVASYRGEHQNIKGISISIGQRVRENRLVSWDKNFPKRKWHDFQVGLSSIGLPVEIINDGESACLAEATLGKYKNEHSIAMIVLGSAVGGGFKIGDEIVNGKWSAGGELSPTLVTNSDGKPMKSVFAIGLVFLRRRYAKKTGLLFDKITGEQIFKEYDKKIEPGFTLVTNWFFCLGQLVHNTIYFYGPDVLLLAGGITTRPSLLSEIKERVYQIMPESEIVTKIDIAEFTKDAGLVGAVCNYIKKHG